MASQCPLCFANRSDLEKEGKSYTLHLDHDHNFWKYNNYICYLSQKNKKDLTGQEGKVWKLYQERSTHWIPQAKTQDQKEADQADKLREEKIDKLETKIEECVELLKDIKEKLDAPKPTEKGKDDLDLDLDLK